MSGLLFLFLLVLIAIGVPIFYCIGLSGISFLVITNLKPMILIPQRMITGLDSFVLVAIPLFICAGYLMESTSISKRLVDCVEAYVGKVRGSFGIIALICCAIFAALTGSGPATVAAIGSVMLPGLLKTGYKKKDAAGLLAAGGALGPIIPPSGVMIVYGATMNVSIVAMFTAGIIPGLILCLLMCIANQILVRKWEFPKPTVHFTMKEKFKRTKRALGCLVLPVIVLGGIYGGVCTPTEAAAGGLVYAILLSLIYRELDMKILVDVFKRSVVTSAATTVLLSGGAIFGWLLAATGLPAAISNAVISIVNDKIVFMIFLLVILFLIGCLMDALTSTIILAPILIPIGIQYGYDPLHIGVVFCIALIIGFITPPFGIDLFTAVSLTGESFNNVVKGSLPYLVALTIGVMLFAFIPEIVLFLPNLLLK
jgi:C4-dicarboxylate transporter DctM subunit